MPPPFGNIIVNRKRVTPFKPENVTSATLRYLQDVDRSNMWQNDARTTPATAIGDQVNVVDMNLVAGSTNFAKQGGTSNQIYQASPGKKYLTRLNQNDNARLMALQADDLINDSGGFLRSTAEEWYVVNFFYPPLHDAGVSRITVGHGCRLGSGSDDHLYTHEFNSADLDTGSTGIVPDEWYLLRIQSINNTSYKVWLNKLMDAANLFYNGGSPGDFSGHGANFGQPDGGVGESIGNTYTTYMAKWRFGAVYQGTLSNSDATNLIASLQTSFGPDANSVLNGLCFSFPMNGAAGANEVSSANSAKSWTLTKQGNPGAGTLAGGACRTCDGVNDGFILSGDAMVSLNYSRMTIGYAVSPSALGGNQIAYGYLSGGGVPGWMERFEGNPLVGYQGDAGGSFSSKTLVSSASNGTTYVVTRAFDFVSNTWRVCVNGTFTTFASTGTGPISNAGGNLTAMCWSGGQRCAGSITALAGWLVYKSDADQTAWQNSGSPQRL